MSGIISIDNGSKKVYSGTSDNGHSEEWITSLQWTNCSPSAYCPYISTSEEGTTSEQWTKHSSQMCPLFGGSTEVNKYSLHQKLRQHYQREGVLGYVVD